MKRNQMLRIIANTIYNNTLRSSMLETMPLAEKVLQEVEKHMAPPPFERFPGSDHLFEIRQWEEDDGKLDPLDPTIWKETRE